jgi:molybdenum cofactor guanylyltransferase
LSLSAVILCGGDGTRMQGIDKPLQPLAGRPLLQHVLDVLRPQADDLIVVANRRHEDYTAYGLKLVDDGAFRGRGPLAGIAAGLAAASSAWVLCVPGDAPLLPPDLLQRLQAALLRDDAELAVAHDGQGRQPLCCLLPQRLHQNLLQFLQQGGDAPRLWQERHRVAEADCADWPRWAWSLNTPEEWATAEARLGAGGDAR